MEVIMEAIIVHTTVATAKNIMESITVITRNTIMSRIGLNLSIVHVRVLYLVTRVEHRMLNPIVFAHSAVRHFMRQGVRIAIRQ